jgi:hypothetical protein
MALRREYDRREWTRLAASGCTLDVPDWPEEFGTPSVPELSVWQRVWKSPQAIVWHNDRMRDTVAVYVRVMLDAAQPGAAAALITQFRQLSEQLLLTTPSLRAARYFIEGGVEETFAERDPDSVPIQPNTLARTGTEDAMSIMRRFKVVKPLDDDDDNGDPAADGE